MHLFILSFLCLCCLWVMISDLKSRRIPNVATLTLFVSALLAGGIHLEVTWYEQVLSGLYSSGFLALVRFAGNVFLQQDSMGFGDIKLAGAIGALLGFPGFLLSLFIASFFAVTLVYGARLISKDLHGKHIPLGFYLGLATFALIGLHLIAPEIFANLNFFDPLHWL
ncbi:MAG: prepilin peptidase [Calditrichia bacterium]